VKSIEEKIMSILFEPIRIGNLEMENRFIRSATYFALSDFDGFVSDAGLAIIRKLAENNVGLIVTGYAYVLKSGQVFPDMNGIQDDDHIPGFQKMTEAVHQLGGRIVMQIVHGGADSQTVAKKGGDYMTVSLTGKMPDHGREPREMTEEDIEGIIEAFGQAAGRVQQAGFDGVQIHGAHGYLISQFLSPCSNHRKDGWGGSLEKRMRFVIEVTRAIKRNVDDDFPVMIKLGCRDYVEEPEGLTIEEGAEISRALEREGVCLIEISHGFLDRSYRRLLTKITSQEREALFLPDARVVREATSIPLSLVGGMRSFPVMEEVVQSGVADCISLCRPFIREPGLVRRWKEGVTGPAECISCYKCFSPDPGGTLRIC
jgi:2,4-dienoyl-CoA reductase-like NADH-dependent reductase (Old Yellow Enzyme family)